MTWLPLELVFVAPLGEAMTRIYNLFGVLIIQYRSQELHTKTHPFFPFFFVDPSFNIKWKIKIIDIPYGKHLSLDYFGPDASKNRRV